MILNLYLHNVLEICFIWFDFLKLKGNYKK